MGSPALLTGNNMVDKDGVNRPRVECVASTSLIASSRHVSYSSTDFVSRWVALLAGSLVTRMPSLLTGALGYFSGVKKYFTTT